MILACIIIIHSMHVEEHNLSVYVFAITRHRLLTCARSNIVLAPPTCGTRVIAIVPKHTFFKNFALDLDNQRRI